MSTYKYSRVTLNRRKGVEVFKGDNTELLNKNKNVIDDENFRAPQNLRPLFPSFLGATVSLYTISFYAEWRYLETTGLYLALAPLFVGFFVSAVFYCIYGSTRYSMTKNAHESPVKGLDICIIWRKICIPILFHVVGILAIVLICLRLDGVLQRYEWVYLFIPLYVMDLLMASFIIKSSEKECWQRPLVAFITWASGSTFLVLLALQMDNKIDFPPFILFIPMYVNVLALLPYLFYWFNAGPCGMWSMILGVMLFIAPTIVLIVLRLCSVFMPLWPICMSPSIVLATLVTAILIWQAR